MQKTTGLGSQNGNWDIWKEVTQLSKSLFPSESLMEPAYINRKYKDTISIDNAFASGYFKSFIESHQNTLFEKKLSGLARRHQTSKKHTAHMMVTNLTQTTFTFPNIDALKLNAKKYAEKYEIPIIVSKLGEIPELLDQFKNKNFGSGFYIGVVVVYPEDEDHAIPVLCYFGKNEETQLPFIECAIMDSFGMNSQYQPIDELYTKTIEHFRGFEINRIFLSAYACQFFPYLGPTRAIVLLRNMLLDLKHAESSRPLSVLLKDYLVVDTPYLASLPPQWSYTDEIADKRGMRLLVIRNLFSKSIIRIDDCQIMKSDIPFTLYDFRAKYQKKVTKKCQLTINNCNFLQIFNNINLPPEVKIFFDADNNASTIFFRVELFTFGYLFNKGSRNARDLEGN